MRIDEIHLIEKIRHLSPDKMKKVSDFIEEIEDHEPKKTHRLVGGALEHLGLHVSAEDIDQARREMWANFPRDFSTDKQ